MRTRTTGEISPEYGLTTWEGTCFSNEEQVRYLGRKGQQTTTTDVVTPNFAIRRDRGEIFNNPFDRVTEICEISVKDGSVRSTDGCGANDPSIWTGQPYAHQTLGYHHAPSPFSSVGNNLRTLASTQAAASIAAPDIDFLIELAELPEAVGLMKHPLEQVRKIVNEAEGRGRSRGLSAGQFIAGNWLAYRYGLVPAMSSLSAAVELLKDRGNAYSKRNIARGYASAGIQDDTTTGTFAEGQYWKLTRTTETTYKADCRAGFLYNLELSSYSPWGSFHQWPSTAIELVKYSFVYDWFVNISEYVKALEYKPGVNILAAWTTLRESTIQESEILPTWKNPTRHVELASPKIDLRTDTRHISRLPGSRVGLSKRYDPFGFNAIPDATRILDSMSLIINKLR